MTTLLAPASSHTKEKGGKGKTIAEGSEGSVDVLCSMWPACYSPGCGEEAHASWDSPYDAPPDTGPGPWALKADRADVNGLPAALSQHCSSEPQRLQAWLMSFKSKSNKNNNTLKNSLFFIWQTSASYISFAFTIVQWFYCVQMQTHSLDRHLIHIDICRPLSKCHSEQL